MQSSTLNYRNFAGWLNPPLESLSRMMGNYHVRFLGDKGGVIRLRYPTMKEDSSNHNITGHF